MLRILMVSLLALCATPALADDLLEECFDKSSSIHAGMTRTEIEMGMEHDGGESGIYKKERFLFTGLKPDEQPTKEWSTQKFCMINIDFHPYGLSNAIYTDADQFAKWVKINGWHPNPKDVAVKIYLPFVDTYHTD